MQTESGAGPRTITATKMRRDLGAILDAVLIGETIHVERNGRPLCVLVPPAKYAELTRAADEKGPTA
jgi:prevent-host-death family protein